MGTVESPVPETSLCTDCTALSQPTRPTKPEKYTEQTVDRFAAVVYLDVFERRGENFISRAVRQNPVLHNRPQPEMIWPETMSCIAGDDC